jgi:hypothetical protein
MEQNALALGANIVLASAKEVVIDEDTLDEKAIKVFKLALNDSYTWFATTDNDRFMIGIVALTALVDEETKGRIKQEVDFLRAINVASTGIPIDFGAMLIGDMKPIGLQRLFEKAKVAPIER